MLAIRVEDERLAHAFLHDRVAPAPALEVVLVRGPLAHWLRHVTATLVRICENLQICRLIGCVLEQAGV